MDVWNQTMSSSTEYVIAKLDKLWDTLAFGLMIIVALFVVLLFGPDQGE